MSADAAQVVSTILMAIVSRPEAVVVARELQDGKVRIAVRVDPQDLGKVIGKQGRTINAIRAVARVTGERTHEQVFVDLQAEETMDSQELGTTARGRLEEVDPEDGP